MKQNTRELSEKEIKEAGEIELQNLMQLKNNYENFGNKLSNEQNKRIALISKEVIINKIDLIELNNIIKNN